MILESLAVDPSDLAARTGWEAKPEGLCKGDRCVPIPGGTGSTIDAMVLSERLGMPLLQDEVTGRWVLGPEGGGRALTTAVAPQLELPNLDGNPFNLATLHGRKVLLVAWASW
jgi:hypothetical protein